MESRVAYYDTRLILILTGCERMGKHSTTSKMAEYTGELLSVLSLQPDNNYKNIISRFIFVHKKNSNTEILCMSITSKQLIKIQNIHEMKWIKLHFFCEVLIYFGPLNMAWPTMTNSCSKQDILLPHSIVVISINVGNCFKNQINYRRS
jgi:hypothetical protein